MRICKDTRWNKPPKAMGDQVTGKYCQHRRHNKKCGDCKDVIKQEE